ncbi:MAG: hypothetical protein IKO80_07305 [Lachnospiraceae bacterium]|nr:hypothetical protein [Lachnospiraceae bacterium]
MKQGEPSAPPVLPDAGHRISLTIARRYDKLPDMVFLGEFSQSIVEIMDGSGIAAG